MVHHTKGCIDAGCTIEEISEMMEVCVAMGGGPATVYAGKSLRIAEELLK
ncbi:MAG: carboxymuconolactone decarboxylase family protein [Finegoldia magna]|nr:carboxymuconolactone decarboxylase family protein [Finegoldia magna]